MKVSGTQEKSIGVELPTAVLKENERMKLDWVIKWILNIAQSAKYDCKTTEIPLSTAHNQFLPRVDFWKNPFDRQESFVHVERGWSWIWSLPPPAIDRSTKNRQRWGLRIISYWTDIVYFCGTSLYRDSIRVIKTGERDNECLSIIMAIRWMIPESGIINILWWNISESITLITRTPISQVAIELILNNNWINRRVFLKRTPPTPYYDKVHIFDLSSI